MAEEPPPPPIRLMNFVSEEQLDEVKKTRGERVEDGTAQRDRPLFEILKENKDKKDAEFNERFKHSKFLYCPQYNVIDSLYIIRPPKALDEDETEFLDNLEMSRREYEKQLARDEELQLRSFQAAVAAQSNFVHELKETSPDTTSELLKREHNPAAKKNTHPRSPTESTKALEINAQEPQGKEESPNGKTDSFNDATKLGLVSYSDESDDD
ncbi:unnamed protein product [Rhodiola kirilowii]